MRLSQIVSVVFVGAIAALIAITSATPDKPSEPELPPLLKDPEPVEIKMEPGDKPVSSVTIPPKETTPPQQREGVIAERGYERILHGRRSAVMRVTWSRIQHEGEWVIRDVTRDNHRSSRNMGGHHDTFETRTRSDLLRTESGELISMTTKTQQGDRLDTQVVTRVGDGYRVEIDVGGNRESFVVDTNGPVHLDAESFLVPKIVAGEAKPGDRFTMRILSVGQKKVIESLLRVVGQDDEGPGLKVAQYTQGSTTLWWFAKDGAVVRNRYGDTIIRRADHLKLTDLPRRPAVYPITVRANIDLPRLFTNRKMVVDVRVRTDDTIQLPEIPENPFTQVVKKEGNTLRLLLTQHDDPLANTPYPLPKDHDPALDEFLKATPLMEVDDPLVRSHAKRAVRDAKDMRTAAANISDYVFRMLCGLGSPDIGQPTAKQILQEPAGDCSEHCLLFTALCRAAGVPARRCSGFVCIGGDWGGHAWCEIWVGKWIGADPTTNEIGTRARYIFCTRQDDTEIKGATIHAGRTRIFIRSAEYDDGKIDFESGKLDRTVFTGVRFVKLPEDWRIEHTGAMTSLRTPDFRIDAHFQPDQGYRALDMLRFGSSRRTIIAGRPALMGKYSNVTMWRIPTGRQILNLRVTADGNVPFGGKPYRLTGQFSDIESSSLLAASDNKAKLSGVVAGSFAFSGTKIDELSQAEIEIESPAISAFGTDASDVKGSARYDQERLALQLTGRALDGSFALSGTALGGTALGGTALGGTALGQQPDLSDLTIEGRIKTQDVQLGALRRLMQATELPELEGTAQLDLTFKVVGPSLSPTCRGRFVVNDLRWGRRNLVSSASAELVLSNDAIRIENVAAQFAEGTATGEITIMRASNNKTFRLALRNIRARRLAQFGPRALSSLDGRVNLLLEGKADQDWRGRGQVDMSRADLAGMSIQRLRIPFQWAFLPQRSNWILVARDAHANFARGRVSADLQMLVGRRLDVKCAGRLERISLTTLLRRAPGVVDSVGGTLSAQFQFGGRDVRSLNDVTGKYHGKVVQSRVLMLPIFREMAASLGLGTLTRKFDVAEVEGRLSRGGVLRLDRVTLANNNLQMDAAGRIWLNGRIDLDVAAHVGEFAVETALGGASAQGGRHHPGLVDPLSGSLAARRRWLAL